MPFIDEIFGLITAGVNNLMAGKREEEARRQNYLLNEQSAENADKRTRALYNDLYSPQAQLQQVKEAGLSPSLFYGQAGGVSGQTGAQGSGAAGVSPTTYGIDPLQLAQIRNLNAQSQKTEAEAQEVHNIAKADVTQKLADAGYKEAATCYTEAQTFGEELRNYVLDNTKDVEIQKAFNLSSKAASEAEEAIYQLVISANMAEISEATKESQIAEAAKKVELLDAQILVNKSLAKLNDAQRTRIAAEIQKWQEEIAQGWQHLANELQDIHTRRQFNEIIDNYNNGLVKNLEERLSFDKDVFGKEYGLNKGKFIWTIVNDNMNRFMRGLTGVVTN